MPIISFRMEKQKAAEWCWAAVAASVDHYFDPHSRWRQCGIVKEVLSRSKRDDAPTLPMPVCCKHPIPRRCNQPWYLEDALKQLGRLKSAPKAGHLSFLKIQSRIDAGRPVCVRIGWREGDGGHFVVISGYHLDRAGGKHVDIEDPLYGGSVVTYHKFVFDYRSAGKWTHTYPVGK